MVLIHGISIPMWTWDEVVPPLVQAGFRVLRYDAFGRGESDYPRDTDIPRDSIHYTRSKLQPKLYREVDGADHDSILQPMHQLSALLISFFSGAAGV